MIFLLILNKLPNCLKPIPLGEHNLLKTLIDYLLFDSIQRSLIVHAIQFEIALKMIALFSADLFDELDEDAVIIFGLGCLEEDA